jgi:hypothetical protein
MESTSRDRAKPTKISVRIVKCPSESESDWVSAESLPSRGVASVSQTSPLVEKEVPFLESRSLERTKRWSWDLTWPESNKTVLTRTSSNLLDWCPSRDLKPQPPQFKSNALLLESNCMVYYVRLNVRVCKFLTVLEAGSNTSTVALRVVGSDEKGTQCLGV